MPLDPKKDFTPLSLSLYSPNVLVANASSGFTSLDDVVRAARANPGSLNYASPGNGSPGHLSAEILKSVAKIDIVHVPYRAAGPAILDLIAGHVLLGMVAVAAAINHIKSGALIGLAVTSRERVKSLPHVQTMAESGFRDYRVNAFHGVFAPANIPPAIAKKLEQDITAVLKEPEVS